MGGAYHPVTGTCHITAAFSGKGRCSCRLAVSWHAPMDGRDDRGTGSVGQGLQYSTIFQKSMPMACRLAPSSASGFHLRSVSAPCTSSLYKTTLRAAAAASNCYLPPYQPRHRFAPYPTQTSNPTVTAAAAAQQMSSFSVDPSTILTMPADVFISAARVTAAYAILFAGLLIWQGISKLRLHQLCSAKKEPFDR